MSSKLVYGTAKLGNRVAATTANPARNRRAMQGLIELCSDVVPEGTTSLTVEEAQHYLGRQIEHNIRELRAEDDDHVAQMTELGEERQLRNRSFTELYAMVLQARRAVEVLHGPDSGKKLLGFTNEVPTEPTRLRQAAERCRRWLLESRFEFDKEKFDFLKFEPETMAQEMEEPLLTLGTSLDGLPAEEKNSVDTLAAKLRRMRDLDRMIGQAARFLEALYDLAGMDLESDRIRQTSHRASSQAASDGSEGVPPAETPGEEAQTAQAQTAGVPPTETPAAGSPSTEETAAGGQPAEVAASPATSVEPAAAGSPGTPSAGSSTDGPPAAG